jgi:hypothetical protein
VGGTGADAVRHPGTNDSNTDHREHDPARVTTDEADDPNPDHPNPDDPDDADGPGNGNPDDADADDADDPDADDGRPYDTGPNTLSDPLDAGNAQPGRTHPHGHVTDPVSRFGGRL